MSATLQAQVDAVRRFNRFYTRRIGVLREGLLDSDYSLTEVRVLYELAHRDGVTASELAADLDLDRGYLSRILKRFHGRGLIARRATTQDARRQRLRLTAQGHRVFAPLDQGSQEQVRALLRALPPSSRRRLVSAMGAIARLLGPRRSAPRGADEVLLRRHRPGDLGWIVQRHGELYWAEYGYDERFEAIVAGIVAGFVERHDPSRERFWIAERDGERVGSIALVARSARIAKLRLLLVEPSARGLGLGRRLVDECLAFAREAGYRRIELWTQGELDAARHIYVATGFRKIGERRYDDFGRQSLVAETWALELAPQRQARGDR